jgi:hypothetical protein
MLVNFKTDVEDNVWFLWCASVRVATADEGDLGGDGTVAATGLPQQQSATPSRGGGLESHSSLSRISSSLAPVCLNPVMSSPARPPPSKSMRAMESVCPFTGKPLGEAQPYFVTYKTILEYSNTLDARMHTRRAWDEVPPLLARVCPDLDGEKYAKERNNPLSLFLYTRVLVSEEAYLDFSAVAMPGLRVLPGITGRAKQRLISSLSAPNLAPRSLPPMTEGEIPAARKPLRF